MQRAPTPSDDPLRELVHDLATRIVAVNHHLDGFPPYVRDVLLGATTEQYFAQYARLGNEQGQQISRRAAATDRVFTLVGIAIAMILAAFTAGAGVRQPLIGLYGCAVVALLVPVLFLSAYGEREHADLRLGQLAYWLRRFHEPLLPVRIAWDTRRRHAFPTRRWFRRRREGEPPLAEPANLQLVAARLTVVIVDGMALITAIGALVGAAVVGPWWSKLMLLPGALLTALSSIVMAVTLSITRHARDHSAPSSPASGGGQDPHLSGIPTIPTISPDA